MADVSRRSFLRGLMGWLGVLAASGCQAVLRPTRPAVDTREPRATTTPPRRSPVETPAPAASTLPAGPATQAPAGVPPTGTPTPLPRLTYPFPVVHREEWGARAPDLKAREEHGLFDPQNNPFGWEVYTQPLQGFLSTLVVHHSALPPSQGPREIQALHMDLRGWADVGYHFIVGPDGTIYEGRDLRVRGRQVSGANTGTVGICMMGNFEEIPSPPEAQLAGLARLLGYLAATYNVAFIAGHRDFNPGTLCPGFSLYPHVDEIAQRFGLKHSTLGYSPPGWVLTQTPDGRQ